jgi:hypothetical protein
VGVLVVDRVKFLNAPGPSEPAIRDLAGQAQRVASILARPLESVSGPNEKW